MLKQSLNAFQLIQQRFNLDSTSFNTVSRGWQTVSALALQQNRIDVEANVEAVCSGLSIIKIQLDNEAKPKQTKEFKNHVYSFLLFVSSGPRYQSYCYLNWL